MLYLFQNQKIVFFFFFILFFLGGCKESCYENYFQNITEYKINPVYQTPKGIGLDVTDVGIFPELNLIDERVDKIEECILNVTKSITKIEPIWQCIRALPVENLKRECIIIKVVQPVYSKCQSNWNLLPILAPEQLCIEKGIIPTKECPCRWRSVVQDDNVIITPPALYLWDIVKIYTGCNNFWYSPFAACAMF